MTRRSPGRACYEGFLTRCLIIFEDFRPTRTLECPRMFLHLSTLHYNTSTVGIDEKSWMKTVGTSNAPVIFFFLIFLCSFHMNRNHRQATLNYVVFYLLHVLHQYFTWRDRDTAVVAQPSKLCTLGKSEFSDSKQRKTKTMTKTRNR